MTKPTADLLTRDLLRLLTELHALYSQAGALMAAKLEAIKAADTNRMAAFSAREMTLANRMVERDGLRRQLIRKLVAALELPGPLPEPIRLSDLAEHFAEPRRSALLSLSAGLQQKVREVEHLSTITRLVTQEMLAHLGEVIKVMTAGEIGAEVYGRSGRPQPVGAAHVFEAVG